MDSTEDTLPARTWLEGVRSTGSVTSHRLSVVSTDADTRNGLSAWNARPVILSS